MFQVIMIGNGYGITYKGLPLSVRYERKCDAQDDIVALNKKLDKKSESV